MAKYRVFAPLSIISLTNLENCLEFVKKDINKLIIEELKLVNFVNE